MGGKQTKVKPFDTYSTASDEKKKAFREVIVKRIRELENENNIDILDVNEYMYDNHRDVYLRMTRQEMLEIISSSVKRPHIVLPNHIWFVRQSS